MLRPVQSRYRSRTDMLLRSLFLLAAFLSAAIAKTDPDDALGPELLRTDSFAGQAQKIFKEQNSGCEQKVKDCEQRNLKRPVCGSDDKTYPTRCHLLRAKCAGNRDLSVEWRGPCSERRPCWEHRHADLGGSDGQLAYRAKCLSDGTYAPVQCHKGTEYCWCVTLSGVPIPNTNVRHGKPKCHRGKQKRFKNPRAHRRRKGKGKVCGKLEKAKFKRNLTKKFYTDLCRLLREKSTTACENGFLNDNAIKKGVEWKFEELDVNADRNLTTDEYQEFQKLVKKAVSPQKCSRSFINICDENKDSVITFEEWTACLVISLDTPIRKSIPMERGSTKKNDFPHPGPPVLKPSIPVSEPTDDTGLVLETDRIEEGSDCLTDRQSVFGEQDDVNFELFLPECTPDGRYQKVQCYKSTGYCWCVNEDTGKPIPGTSKKDHDPNCDALQLPNRPMIGCPEPKKKLFLKELKEFFKKQNRSGTEIKITETEEDFSVMTFQLIDTNKNKFLEKKEMRPLRAQLATFSQPVRRCGKKFPKYCDVNHDRKISMTEWMNCMDSERSGMGMTVKPGRTRGGTNPLETILKSDD